MQTYKGDDLRLRQVLINLVGNAIKFTEKGQVKITVAPIELAIGEGCFLQFSVQDSGIGIEAKHLPRLTERFYRVDSSRASHTGGTGLGLAIVKHVLLRHRGRLDISSTPGKGSTFTCHFPASQAVRRH